MMKDKGREESLNLPKLTFPPKCPRCGKEISLERFRLGFPLCVECTPQTRVKEVNVAATSLHWI